MHDKSNTTIIAIALVAVSSFLAVIMSFSIFPANAQISTPLQANTTMAQANTTMAQANTTMATPNNTMATPNNTMATGNASMEQANTSVEQANTTMAQANTTMATGNTTMAQANQTAEYKYEPFYSLKNQDYQDVSDNLTPNLTKFSIVTWFKTSENYTNPGHMVNKGGMNSDEEGMNMNYGVWITNTNQVEGGFEDISGENFFVNSTSKYNDGKWHHTAVTFNGTEVALYIDGKLIDTQFTNASKPDTTGTQPLRIGANSLDEDKFFTGDIDEIRIWDRPLSQSEVEDAYIDNNFNSTGQKLFLSYGAYTNKDISNK
ncbi:MAG: LamG domain-containing protein [Nitrososphaeraceae archaeon]|nr:LamG domain-containing protein [Nitrososphaeraceae archaeon]